MVSTRLVLFIKLLGFTLGWNFKSYGDYIAKWLNLITWERLRKRGRVPQGEEFLKGTGGFFPSFSRSKIMKTFAQHFEPPLYSHTVHFSGDLNYKHLNY